VEKLRLMQYAAAWGSPSLLPACTKANAYLRFCALQPGRDFEVEEPRAAQATWAQQLPVVQAGAQLLDASSLYSGLRARGLDADAPLTAAQRAESAAWSALIEERLGVALLFSWWEEADNYATVIRPAFAGRLPIPLCFYMPWTMRRRAHSQLARRSCLDPEVVYAIGEEALAALAQRLDGLLFFHSGTPSSVDASAFAYLTAILRCPLPSDRLRRCMRGHAQLVSYCERISERYFGVEEGLLPAAQTSDITHGDDEALRSMEVPSASSEKSTRTPKQQRFKRRSRNALLAAGGSAVLYALAVNAFGEDANDLDEYESEDE